MKRADLKILGIQSPLRDKEEFYDDGFVASLQEYKAGLLKKYNSYQPEEVLNSKDFGTTGTFWVGDRIYYHIAYIDQGSEVRNLNTRAHEETHVLADSGSLELLIHRILIDLNLTLNLSLINEPDKRDVIAEIGGIYAVLKSGMDPENIKEFRAEQFQAALRIYEAAKNIWNK
jgi:hypothetical protein